MADENQDQEAANESSSSTGRVFKLVALLVGLAAGAVVGVMVVGPEVALRTTPGSAARPPSAEGEEDHGDGGGGKTSVPTMKVIENLVVNPAQSGGTRFLLVSIALKLGEGTSQEAVDAREVELRDALIRILGSRTVAELADMNRRPDLVQSIREALDETLGEGAVEEVYFPQFVIQ